MHFHSWSKWEIKTKTVLVIPNWTDRRMFDDQPRENEVEFQQRFCLACGRIQRSHF